MSLALLLKINEIRWFKIKKVKGCLTYLIIGTNNVILINDEIKRWSHCFYCQNLTALKIILSCDILVLNRKSKGCLICFIDKRWL